MSGTSLDGIDLAYVHFEKKKSWTFSIKKTQTIGYTAKWQNILTDIHQEYLAKVETIEEKYTDLLIHVIKEFIQINQIEVLDAICSHGHTIVHDPDRGITYQMGNKSKMATELNQVVVCDFRRQDVALGGQGAPLVPIGDQLLFSEYNACLNLGGFANSSTHQNGKMTASDLCAVNTILNRLAQKKGWSYDENGQLAKQGRLIPDLLSKLNSLDFYQQSAPKSLGVEWLDESITPLLSQYALEKVEDIIYTFTLHIAHEIGGSFHKGQRVLVTGGGAKNIYLMQLIQEHSSAHFEVPHQQWIDFKEALVFGFLGVLRLREEVNCLASVTGASRDHSSGIIFHP
jgi:anhydro-N-acetylmuramic acid kinase